MNRLLGSMRADVQGDGVMVVAIPTERVPALYARLGEFVPAVALVFTAVTLLLAIRASPQNSQRRVASQHG